MRVVILGNGLAGTISGRTIRELDSEAEVIICSEEKYPYYPRPNLIDFLAGLIPLEKVFAFSEGWAEKQRLQIQLGQRAVAIETAGPTVEFEDGRKLSADYLVLATGACPATIPVAGLDKEGIFTIRNLDDVLQLLEAIRSGPEVVILGGGLLGLELARALKMRGVERVSVVEVFSRLLPRQLDERGAGLLQTILEKTGIKFFTGREATEILGESRVSGVRLKDGQTIPAGVVIIAAGVKPRLDLARAAGLPCQRGVVVDDYLRTGQERIYAAGDVTEHRGRVYGLIPAAFDQARTLAYNLCGQSKKYEGTIPASTLKVAGIYLTSIGLVNPEEKSYDFLTDYRPELGIYRKLVFKGESVVGAIWFGSKKGAQEISRLIQSGKQIGKFKNQILEDDFNFSRLFEEN